VQSLGGGGARVDGGGEGKKEKKEQDARTMLGKEKERERYANNCVFKTGRGTIQSLRG